MDYSKYQYQILCEDKAHYNFVRGWLMEKGAHSRRLNCYGDLPHSGSGKEFVYQNLSKALEEIRKKFNLTKTFLIVVLDADNRAVDDVAMDFREHDFDPDHAPVFFVIAKWSLDTWVRFLMKPEHSEALEEGASCKNEIRKATRDGFTRFGRTLARMSLETTDRMPDSLRFSWQIIRKKKEFLHLV